MKIILQCFGILILIEYIFNQSDLKGIYLIGTSINNYKLDSSRGPLIFRRFNIIHSNHFRILPINSIQFYIESKNSEKRLSLNEKNEVILIGKNDDKLKDYNFWNIIKINDNEYVIQNNKTKTFLESVNFNLKSNNLTVYNNIEDYQKVQSSFKFKLFKLFEEAYTKPEYMKFIDEEPVDVVIKYIDLSDKTLNRDGIKQIFKDEDHEELRYCVRSIFQNIPWFRKIFIVMPNEKVRYFKPINEIKDRIVYIKDKDVMGFDSASIYAFHFYLWNLSQFNISDNFILMDDDYFIGRPINKSRFFYYDEEQKKVLPNIVSDEYRELEKNFVFSEYNKYFSKINRMDPHTALGWSLHTYAGFKLLFENFKGPLVHGGFTHNAISVNIHDMKEIYEFVKSKYQYANELLYSKVRSVYDIQSHTFFNSYLINVKNRKARAISRKFCDLLNLRKTTRIDQELFVINTSGEGKYNDQDFQNLKKFLEAKFNTPTPFEIEVNENNTTNDTSRMDIKSNNTSNSFYKNIFYNCSTIDNSDIKLTIQQLEDEINILSSMIEQKKNGNYFLFYMIIIINCSLTIILILLLIFICLNNTKKLHNKKHKNKNFPNYEEERFGLNKN